MSLSALSQMLASMGVSMSTQSHQAENAPGNSYHGVHQGGGDHARTYHPHHFHSNHNNHHPGGYHSHGSHGSGNGHYGYNNYNGNGNGNGGNFRHYNRYQSHGNQRYQSRNVYNSQHGRRPRQKSFSSPPKPNKGVSKKSSAVPVPGVLKMQEMSPETSLIEFISTTASLRKLDKTSISKLEIEIIKIFPNNVMPANAAAWYMAKRRFYRNNNSYQNSLLLYIMKNHPNRFRVQRGPGGGSVQFLDSYSKEVAKKKLDYMVRSGLVAYFSHKVEEYGVYFFDPKYYETSEPFRANLKTTCGMKLGAGSNRMKTIPRFFKQYKDKFVYKQHSPYLATISKESVEVCINQTGVIVTMIDGHCGVIRFLNGDRSEKAIFSMKALYNEGYPYKLDPLKLQSIKFDGFKLPAGEHGSNECSWYAVLVWSGRKPNPKYCATIEDLRRSPLIKNNNVAVATDDGKKPITFNEFMQVGEVLEIRTSGAVVSMGKDNSSRAFIPGFPLKNKKYKGSQLMVTFQGVELALKDVVAFYIDPNGAQTLKAVKGVTPKSKKDKKSLDEDSDSSSDDSVKKQKQSQKSDLLEEEKEFVSFGCNVMIIKIAERIKGNDDLGNDGKKLSAKEKKQLKDKEKASKKRKRNSKSSQTDESESDSEGKKTKEKQIKPKRSYRDFLLVSNIAGENEYDSDLDPGFMPRAMPDPELEFDEYSDGELSTNEEKDLIDDANNSEFDPEKMKTILAEDEQKRKDELAKQREEKRAAKKAEWLQKKRARKLSRASQSNDEEQNPKEENKENEEQGEKKDKENDNAATEEGKDKEEAPLEVPPPSPALVKEAVNNADLEVVPEVVEPEAEAEQAK